MRYASLLLCATAIASTAAPAQDPPIGPPSSRHSTGLSKVRPVQLEPASQAASSPTASSRPVISTGLTSRIGSAAVDLGSWSYRIERGDPNDGVPWRLIATPLSGLAEKLKQQESFNPPQHILEVPLVRVPDAVWSQWFDRQMQDVVGIHYHEFLPEGVADLLVTLHKVPPDGPDGQPPRDYRGKRGTRLEATLLKPLAYHLDQTFVVKIPKVGEKAELADHRLEHERGHGQVSLGTLIATLGGPATWNAQKCTGRRSSLRWFWSTQKISRRWDGYHGGSGELQTLRTTITLAPPTRWSMLLPVPPEEVPQSFIQAFNDNIVHLHEQYNKIDRAAQEKFHLSHGSFEEGP